MRNDLLALIIAPTRATIHTIFIEVDGLLLFSMNEVTACVISSKPMRLLEMWLKSVVTIPHIRRFLVMMSCSSTYYVTAG